MKLKYVDNYTWALLIIVAGLIISLKSNKLWIPGVILGIYGFLLIGYTRWKGTGHIVENDFTGEVAIKRESGSNEPEIIPVGSLISGIDGAATDFNHNEVYKIRNGIKVKIMQSGEIRETTLLARLMNTGYTSR